MPAESLFSSETNRSSNRIAFLIGFIALVVITATGFSLYHLSKPKEKTKAEIATEEIRDSAVLMLAQPTFSGDEFETQILGDKGKMERFDWRKREAYFSFPESSEQEFNEFLSKFFTDRAKVEIGAQSNGKIELGNYKMTVSPESFYFFKTPIENVKIAAEQTLNFPFKEVNYSLSLAELKDFINNSTVYGGRLLAGDEQRKTEPAIAFANHGIMVAKPNEPSLQRLISQLLKDESIANDREKKIQRLVDFVSNEIEYSYTEAVGGRETLKRANETLMTRSADCSNKTILLASLLEQIGEEYILLYCPQHITVAVPQGNFANENKLDFTWNGKPWLIAETTLPGFQVGKTHITEYTKMTTVNYVQVPRQTDVIFDANSFNLLKFY
jgi:hypothetical protein